ncbi:MAG: exoribonuclease II [Spirochaetes bacterium]|nr:MAG: exoribonuclease II [Spirochaetota bacterium]
MEKAEGVHKALVDSGLWDRRYNPWPQRAGCALKAPKCLFPEDEIPTGLERMDLLYLESFAIDNAWSNDPDDAIAFDGHRIWVHIADPAAFFKPDSEVDEEALSRGATLYLPEKIVPMLPESALPVLGLGLSPTSPALSFGILIDDDGHIEDTIITPSLVKVSRLSYAQADSLLVAGNPSLTALDILARKRKSRRVQNGAVDIELPEVSIKAGDEEIRFIQVEKTRSADIVKECMLLASEAAGRWSWDRGIPVPYSSQEAPQLPKGLTATDQSEALLSVQFLRRKGMKASVVGPECLAHQGLGLSLYCQATSPLRRYQDLLAHHQIRAGLGSGTVLSSEEIARRCLLANQAASLTRQAERDSRYHWIAVYLSENPGWETDGIVLEARDRDALVMLPSLGLETMVKTRTPCAPDQAIRVRLIRADIANKDLSFDLIWIA